MSLSSLAASLSGKALASLLVIKKEQIQQWLAENGTIKTASNQKKIEEKFNKHLTRTIQRATEISTLVFPQKKIKLLSVYEPLSLTKDDQLKGFHDSINTSIDYETPEKCYILIDEAGMGKSTITKKLTIDIIRESRKFPILLELWSYDKKVSLIENLAQQLDEIDGKFDRALFNKLITTGKLFIILDGYDEMSSETQQVVSKEIRELSEKKGESSLLLTTRPHEKIPSLVNSETIRIKKLDKSQAISIINKYDKISKTDIGKRLIKELGKIPERFLETPLLVGLLYKTFGFNNSIATNTAVFYSEIFDALYKGHDLTKSGYTRDKKSKLEINKFREIIRAFAFFYLAEADIKDYSSQFIIEIIEKSKRLCGCDQIISTDFFEDLLLAVPFLTKDGNNYKFMHRTIAEFFAAEFICSKDDPTKIILEILNSDLSSSFQKTLDFIAEISEQIYNKAITMKICEKFLGKYKSSYDTDYMSETFLFTTQLIITEKNTNKLRQHISNIEDNGYEFFIFGGNQEKYLIFKYKRNLYAPYKALLQISDRITTNRLDISESLKVLEEVMENDKSYNITDRKIKALYTNSSFKKLMRASCELRVNDSHKANFGLGPIDVTKCKHIIDLSNNLEKRNKNLKSILNV